MAASHDSLTEAIAQANGHVARSSDRLAHLFSFVPDDRLTWSPSATSRSPLRIVAHCALTSRFFARTIAGEEPSTMPSPETFFAEMHEAETKIETRDHALALLKETTAELCDAIDKVGLPRIDSTPDSPFGPLPMRFWLQESGDHMAIHAGQVGYLQTVWGDLDNHLG